MTLAWTWVAIVAWTWVAFIATAGVSWVGTGPQEQIRGAVSRTLSLFEEGGRQWKIPCVSCHHQSLVMVTQDAARRHGIALNEAAAGDHAARTLGMLSSFDGAVQGGIDVTAHGYGFWVAQSQQVKPSLATEVLASRFANQQRPEGNWRVNDGRPPHSYSDFTGTALAVRALNAYMPESLAAQRQEHLQRARKWLAASQPDSSEDRTFQLLGLFWAGAPAEERRALAVKLIALQRKDGGWPQVTGTESDAYSTGQVLVALRRAASLPASDPAVQRGVHYLLKTQKADGSWLVRTRLHSSAQLSPPYFESGFPHGKDQFISCAGSAWAAMALLEMLPEVASPAKPQPILQAEPKGIEPWMRVAALGTVNELKELLDAGLDPNTATPEGTSLLMMASNDAGKLRLLLERGAAVNAQARSGATALNLAAGFRDNSAAVRLLLDRGAAVMPDKTRAEMMPVFIASLAGEHETMSILLEHGASAVVKSESGSALLNAVQLGDPEMVRLLAAKGADVNERYDHQLTPLIWAALTHRTEVVRVLLELGADADAKDQFGLTAFDHSSDIAHSEVRTAKLLARFSSPNPSREKRSSSQTPPHSQSVSLQAR